MSEMQIDDKVLELIQEAFVDLENPKIPLSSVMRKTIRIANLTNNTEAIKWLQLNMHTFHVDERSKKISMEVIDKYKISEEEFCEYLTERKISTLDIENTTLKQEGNICRMSILEMEDYIKTFKEQIDRVSPSPKETTLRVTFDMYLNEYYSILHNIRNQIHEFLSITEKQMIYDQINYDIFEKNRRYVDSKLTSIAPEVLKKFIAAYKRIKEKDSESRSQALLSCRRILKSVADNVYPPRKKPIKCVDGKERKLTEDKYINRIVQFVSENSTGSAEKGLSIAEIEYLGNKLNNIDDLASKGVHSDVSEFEVNQCVIQTYLVIGDILHLTDNSSQ